MRCIALDVGGGFGVQGPRLSRRTCCCRSSPAGWAGRCDGSRAGASTCCAPAIRATRSTTSKSASTMTAASSRCATDFIVDCGAWNPLGVGVGLQHRRRICPGPYKIAHLAIRRASPPPTRCRTRPIAAPAGPRRVQAMERLDGPDRARARARAGRGAPAQHGARRRDAVLASAFRIATASRSSTTAATIPARSRRRSTRSAGSTRFAAASARRARRAGISASGIGCYTEGTGVGPFEGATVRIDPSGKIYVSSGACPQGQGMETIFAQIVADAWKVEPDDVVVSLADTAAIPMGFGTIASRSTVNVSAAIHHASERLRDKVFAIAAQHARMRAGRSRAARRRRSASSACRARRSALAKLAQAARPGWDHGRPPGVDAGLEETYYCEPPTVTWAYATHAAIVEVDSETGRVHDRALRRRARLRRGGQPDARRRRRSSAARCRASAARSSRRSPTTRRGSCSPARSWITPCRSRATCPASSRAPADLLRRSTRSASRGSAKAARSRRRSRSPTRCATRFRRFGIEINCDADPARAPARGDAQMSADPRRRDAAARAAVLHPAGDRRQGQRREGAGRGRAHRPRAEGAAARGVDLGVERPCLPVLPEGGAALHVPRRRRGARRVRRPPVLLPHRERARFPRGARALPHGLRSGVQQHGARSTTRSAFRSTHMGVEAPVLPIFVNAYLPPQPPMERCYAFGRALAQVLERLGVRAVLVASGGMSHFPGNQAVFQPEPRVGPARASSRCAAGNLRSLLAYDEKELDDTGNIELRCWAVAAGALGERKPDIVQLNPSWHHNYASLAWWSPPPRRNSAPHYPSIAPSARQADRRAPSHRQRCRRRARAMSPIGPRLPARRAWRASRRKRWSRWTSKRSPRWACIRWCRSSPTCTSASNQAELPEFGLHIGIEDRRGDEALRRRTPPP